MKKSILLFILPLLFGIYNVSADETWTGVNMPPVAVNDTVTTSEDTSIMINLLSNDTDADSDTLSVTSVFNMMNWTWVINASWTWVMFTPSLNFNWTWSFDYLVSDWLLVDTWSVLVTVTWVNDAPVAVDDHFNMTENTSMTLNLVSNDTDLDSNNLKITSLWTILNWTWVINASWTGVVFTPSMNFNWTIMFIYTVSDWSLSDVWNVTVDVGPANAAPVARDDYLSTFKNTVKTIDPRINDTDSNWDILSVSWVTNWLHWSVSFTSVSVTYTPNTDYYWTDSFEYTISDWSWLTDKWKVLVTVHKEKNDDDDEDEDHGNNSWDKFEVKNLQKEFINKFKDLKDQYKNATNKSEYLDLKKQLRAEYLMKLKDITGTNKNTSSVWDSEKQKYITLYRWKYWNKIASFSDEKLNQIITKIDDLIEKINTWNYSDKIKQKYNTILLALRELVASYIDSSDFMLDFDSLFK